MLLEARALELVERFCKISEITETNHLTRNFLF